MKENTTTVTQASIEAFISSARLMARHRANCSRMGAWAVALLIEEGEELDSAMGILRDALAGEDMPSRDRSNAVNGTRIWVPVAVHLLEALRNKQKKDGVKDSSAPIPPKSAWPSLAKVKAILAGRAPSEVTFSYGEDQAEATASATESLKNEGINPTLALIEEQVIKSAKTSSSSSSSSSSIVSPLEKALEFIGIATTVDIEALEVAIKVRKKAIEDAQKRIAQ